MSLAAGSPSRRGVALGALLVAPLFLFLLLVFFVPLAKMLNLAVSDTEYSEVMPRSADAARAWDGASMPPDAAFEAMGLDLADARQNRTIGTPARRLSYESQQWRSVIQSTARALPRDTTVVTDWKTALTEANAEWAKPDVWRAVKAASGPYTSLYLMTALGQRGTTQDLYVSVLVRTFVIALTATVLTVIIALPAAYVLASSGRIVAGALMLALLLPLWTSVLVRSAAWLVILQKTGLVNQALLTVHAIGEPLELIYNRAGVLIALTHILLPYAVLPIYAAMKALPKRQVQAAQSLGAGPVTTFVRVCLPQILPGVSAGALLVFILALGYYITPLLLGGQGDQMLPFYIAYNTLQALNWGLAAALGSVLLVATTILYAVYVRIVGVERVGL